MSFLEMCILLIISIVINAIVAIIIAGWMDVKMSKLLIDIIYEEQTKVLEVIDKQL